MYVRVTVEVWQKGTEATTHKATIILPEEYVQGVAENMYARFGKRVYSKVWSAGYGEDLSTAFVLATGSILTAAYRRYQSTTPAAPQENQS